jgi:DNA-binding NtrC family response regulator
VEKTRLLIVEDDVAVARMLKRVLSRDWGEIVVVYSAVDGIEEILASDSKYDAVITDWDCPYSGDGMGVITAARHRGVPAVLHTGNSTVSSKDFEIVYKPSDVDVINEALSRAVNNK